MFMLYFCVFWLKERLMNQKCLLLTLSRLALSTIFGASADLLADWLPQSELPFHCLTATQQPGLLHHFKDKWGKESCVLISPFTVHYVLINTMTMPVYFESVSAKTCFLLQSIRGKCWKGKYKPVTEFKRVTFPLRLAS